jgi:hypothetical protein
VIVVGGTYAEAVICPAHSDDASGSGMRAASALGGTASLVSCADGITQEVAEAAAAAYRVEATFAERDQPVGFTYFTPVSDPSVDGPRAKHTGTLTADDATVLVFGMVEQGGRDVRAARLVLDPQTPRELATVDRDGLRGDELAVVLNAAEACGIAGGNGTTVDNAGAVLKEAVADVVVVKDSGRGCVVLARGSDPVRVGPHPTRTVWPLGSGDVFAAGFAHAWGAGADPVEAARVASGSAAWWCATRRTVVPPEILSGTSVENVLPDAAPALAVPERAPTVYLAAPFFSLAERWLVETCRSVLAGLGADVFSPLHDVGPGGDEVAAEDLAGLQRCDSVLALLDGWDPGTVYEAGWAHRHGLPVVGFQNTPGHDGTKMLVGTGADIHVDLSSALYNAVWAGQGHVLAGVRVPSR